MPDGPLCNASRDLVAMIDSTADFLVGGLRRTAMELADGEDNAARRDVEGGCDWRDLARNSKR